jgi:soluble lytic murein transglycosylase-like protein
MLNDNKTHFLLGVMLTSLCVMTYKELSHRPPMVETKTPEKDLYDPYVNVTVGIKYLSHLNQHFDDIDATLTAYSHGPTITRKYSNSYIKNNFYVKRVHSNY